MKIAHVNHSNIFTFRQNNKIANNVAEIINFPGKSVLAFVENDSFESNKKHKTINDILNTEYIRRQIEENPSIKSASDLLEYYREKWKDLNCAELDNLYVLFNNEALCDAEFLQEELIKAAKLPLENFNRLLELLKNKTVIEWLNDYTVSDIATLISCSGFDENKFKKLTDILGDFVFLEFIEKYIEDDYDIKIRDIQNTPDFEFVLEKREIQYCDIDDSKDIKKTIIIPTSGKISKYTIERQNNNIYKSWTYNSDNPSSIDRIVQVQYYDFDNENIKYQLEIVYGNSNEPEYIIYTKASDILSGAYETTRYNLKNYDENIDIVSEILNGTIKGEIPLSTVKKDNNSVTLEENYECNGCKIKRKYTKTKNPKNADFNVDYSYIIQDEQGQDLLNLSKITTRNEKNNTTATIINGIEYKAVFDDQNMTIILINPKEKNNLDIKNKFDNKDDAKKFYEFSKNLSVDSLFMLYENVRKVELCPSEEDSYGDSLLQVSLSDKQVFYHEIGHSIDFGLISDNINGNISGNKDLIKIYNSEMNEFRRKYPDNIQKIISYFGQNGGMVGADSGLGEVVAETYMLMNEYGNEDISMSTRAQYLVKYFPKTVAKSVQLIEDNM